jgi:DNA-binding CsgD family transcriptional regulator
MRPSLRLARTADGSNVAYTEMGAGHPVLQFFPAGECNVALDWDLPGTGDWWRSLSNYVRLVRFEVRGLANSDPVPAGKSMLDYVCEDIDAVRTALGLERFSLMTEGVFSVIVLRYAAEHPDNVTSVALHNPLTRRVGWGDSEWRAAYWKTIEFQAGVAGVDTMTYNAQVQAGPFADHATVATLERLIRTNTGPKADALWNKVHQLHETNDYSLYAARVSQRVLINTDSPFFESMARDLAASLPRAVLVLGSDHQSDASVAASDRSSVAAGFARFLKDRTPEASPASAAPWAGHALTARESEVLALLAAGRTTAEIAASLHLSPSTVARHLANVYVKLGIHNRAQATAAYYGHVSQD